ncbi:hypothetical protein B0T21DRAFT_351853 [Apiosordaria backusii]|uniref:Uncharacterized protein n=1 Tax=Apiosordaria backusii TaxID=314023 RepID=A0AA40ANH8_9PEZI|nr:hypothetical protein B0T21DRAFT_351853 [Apiosordaria backusii]
MFIKITDITYNLSLRFNFSILSIKGLKEEININIIGYFNLNKKDKRTILKNLLKSINLKNRKEVKEKVKFKKKLNLNKILKKQYIIYKTEIFYKNRKKKVTLIKAIINLTLSIISINIRIVLVFRLFKALSLNNRKIKLLADYCKKVFYFKEDY